MSDKGFINQDFCSIKRLLLDRLSHQKTQFSRAEVAADFDIAATSIYFKRLPRRVCEWNILNNVWPTQKIGLVASTWRSLYVSHALKRVFQDFSRPDTHTYVNLKIGVFQIFRKTNISYPLYSPFCLITDICTKVKLTAKVYFCAFLQYFKSFHGGCESITYLR